MSQAWPPLKILAQQLRENAGGSVALVEQAFARMETGRGLNAVIRERKSKALEEAAEIDGQLKSGAEVGPLAGIPIVIKDNMAIEGQPVTACSKILKGFIPPYTATAVARLQKAGAVVVGQSNMDEFAMGSSTEYGCYGPCKNPFDEGRVAGGSSGGSAAVVAAGFVPVSLGSDTGGSIRQPASFCGVTGLKPTYGRISRYGLFAYGSSLDQIGPLSHYVEDTALMLSLMQGVDVHDSTTQDRACDVLDYEPCVKGLKVGVPVEFLDTAKGLHPQVKAVIESQLQRLEAAGAEIVEVSLPILDHVISTYYLIANAEASSNLARYDSMRYGHRTAAPENLMAAYKNSRREGFGAEVRNRILIGTYALSAGYYDAFYKKANLLRQDMRRRLDELLSKVDLIAGPTSPGVAFKLAEMTEDPLTMYMQDLYTTFVNLTYSPAISLPAGKVEGLPVGLQLTGRLYDEKTLFRVASMLETAV